MRKRKKLNFSKALLGTRSMQELIKRVAAELKRARNGGRCGYVAGPITADGSEKEFVQANLARLAENTKRIREREKKTHAVIFSCCDIFTPSIFESVGARFWTKGEWYRFWGEVLKSGEVTDIYLTDGWKRSQGAIHEYETAIKCGICIHDEEIGI